MTTASTLEMLQQEALNKLRAGEHSDMLVAFLTTSIMLELSKLVDPSLDLESFASAAVDVLTQYAPINQVALSLSPHDLPAVHAEIGLPESTSEAPHPGGSATPLELADGSPGFLDAHGVPAPLQAAGLIEQAASHLTTGLGRMVESERLRRQAAAGHAFQTLSAIDDQWNEEDLLAFASALAALPGARAAGITVAAARLGGPISVAHGLVGTDPIERSVVIDGHTPVQTWVQLAANHTAEQVGKVNELLDAFLSTIERVEQGVRLKTEIELDELTRVGNRRLASRALAAARNLAERTGESLAVLLCDLDHFKTVNDTHGHAVGDAVLRAFAQMVATTVRNFDTVARWGGEEFLIVCPACDQSGAVSLAERLLRNTPIACGEVLPSGRQTVSVGIAVFPVHATNPDALVRAADNAMYVAKNKGRNTHHTAIPEPVKTH